MESEVSPAVSRAIEISQRWAAALGADGIEPLHIVLALLEEEEGRAASLFEQAGLPANKALVHFQRAAKGPRPSLTALPRSRSAEHILSEARLVAARMGADPTVTSDAFLLAALQVDPMLRSTLEGLGLQTKQIETAVERLHGSSAESIAMDEPLNLENTGDRLDAIRVLDAAANRAREALRVLEDYGRFARNDAVLTEDLKRIRHELTQITLELLPAPSTLTARDTLGDVGRDISTPDERARHSVADIVTANLKRLQEALRSIEEFAKLSQPAIAQRVEQLRYQAYTLEKNIVLATSARKRLEDLSLYVLLTGSTCAAALDWTIAEAAIGGAQIFQMREKELDDRALLDRARRMRRWTRRANACFIVNDRPDIALLSEADGVHLGQTDMPVRDARRILGSEAIIGVSTHDRQQLRQAISDGASYIAVGPTFASQTKEFEFLAGPEFLREAAAMTDIPLFAIGGIDCDNVQEVVAAGIGRVAVGHAIAQAEEPRQVAQSLRAQLDIVTRSA